MMIRFEQTPAPKPPRCMRSATERMADDMLELAFSDQNVSEETLKARGWTQASIDRLGPDAQAVARRRAVRQIAGA